MCVCLCVSVHDYTCVRLCVCVRAFVYLCVSVHDCTCVRPSHVLHVVFINLQPCIQ